MSRCTRNGQFNPPALPAALRAAGSGRRLSASARWEAGRTEDFPEVSAALPVVTNDVISEVEGVQHAASTPKSSGQPLDADGRDEAAWKMPGRHRLGAAAAPACGMASGKLRQHGQTESCLPLSLIIMTEDSFKGRVTDFNHQGGTGRWY